MSTRVVLASDQSGADQWTVFVDAFDTPRGSVVYLELHRIPDATLTVVRESTGALVEVGVPAELFWAMIRGAATARAHATDLYPPLFMVRYDEPPADATGRARVERLDPDAARAADPVWAELAADRAPAASRLAGRLSGVAGTIRRAVDRAIREGVDPLAAVFTEALTPAPIRVEPGDRPAVVARTAATAREFAGLLRRAVGSDDPTAWETLTLTRVPTLGARTLLEACAAGDADAVRDRLAAMGGDGGAR